MNSGLGLQLTLKALDAGFAVIGTVRNRGRAAKEVKQIESRGGKCLELDVTDAKASFEMFQQAERLWQIDVLVNNARVSWLGAIEDFSYVSAKYCIGYGLTTNRDEEAKAQM